MQTHRHKPTNYAAPVSPEAKKRYLLNAQISVGGALLSMQWAILLQTQSKLLPQMGPYADKSLKPYAYPLTNTLAQLYCTFMHFT